MTSVRKVANYEILGPLGAGHLGTVYKAYDHEHEREVALRVMTPEVVRWDASLRAHFREESRAIAALKHSNIAEWYDIGEYGDAVYVASELVPGQDLKHFIADGTPLSIEKKIGAIHQISAGLAYAHRAGVLHRDIRPANVFLQPNGTPKLADFGLASMTAGQLLKAAVRWGSPLYLCPEQIRRKSYDARSEIFAVGTVFYEFLTGVHPFQHSNSNRALDNIASEEHLPSFDPLADAPAGLCSIIARCLAKDPDERFASMSEIEDELNRLLDDIAKECQAMFVELQIAMHRLKRAVAAQDAPPEIGELAQNIRQLLASDHKRDYASLDRLMAVLAEQSTVIHSLTKGPGHRHLGVRPAIPQKEQPVVQEEEPPVPVALACAETASGDPGSRPMPVCRAEREEHPAVVEPVLQVGTSAIYEPAPLQGSGTRHEPLEPLDAGELQYLQILMAEIGGGANASTPAPEPSPRPLVGEETAEERQPPDAPVREALPVVECRALVHCPAVAQKPAWHWRIPWRGLVAAAVLTAGCAALPALWQHRAALSDFLQSGLQTKTETTAPRLAPPAVLESKPQPSYEPAADLLIREARLMGERGRPEASRVFVQRALDLEPENEEAKALLAELDASPPPPAPQDPLRQQVSAAAAFIEAGQLRKASSAITRIAAANPGHPALPVLRRSLTTKNAETGRDAAQKKAEQEQSARKSLADENWSRRAGELFRAGNYAELARVLNQWAQTSPGSIELASIRIQAAEIQQQIALFQASLGERRYSDAVMALARAESLNPADPALPEMRRLLESKKAGANARLTVLRLSDPGVVLLDAAPIGHAGEVHGAAIAVGEHVLSVKLPGTAVLTTAHEFTEGENVSFVYDGTALRPMTSVDLEVAAARKTREQTHKFLVEHPHGVLRGTCRGELLVNGFDVKYVPETGSHGFQIPFARLKMRADGRVVDFRFASDNAAFQTFKIRDISDAEALKQIWSNLQSGVRSR